MKVFLTGLFVTLGFCFVFAQNDSINVSPGEAPKSCPTFTIDTVVKPVYVAYCDSGTASWYGHKWKGRMTASGERFHPDSLTAAHKTLPFGTLVKVTNLKNDSVVIVRITDRLPRNSTRSIDLSPAAAKKLNFYSQGLTRVRMEAIGKTTVRKVK